MTRTTAGNGGAGPGMGAGSDDLTPLARTTATATQTKRLLAELWRPDAEQGGHDVDLVPMLWGDSGTGKTSVVGQAAQETGHPRLVKVTLGKMRPEDFGGVPFPYPEGYTRYQIPKFLYGLTEEGEAEREKQHREAQERYARTKDSERREELGGDPGEFRRMPRTVLFYDEINLAPEDMQGAVHQAIEERKLGAEEFTIAREVRQVAAGNEAKAGFHAKPLSIPMMTRLSPHIDFAPTVDEWVQHARERGFDPRVIAYIQQHPDALDQQRQVTSQTQLRDARGIATRRSWEKASAIAQRISDPDLLAIALTGTVGKGPAAEMLTYLRTARGVPSIDSIAADPGGAPTFNEDPDCAHLVVENVIAAMRGQPRKYLKPLTKYVERLHPAYRAQIMPTIMGAGGAQRASDELLREMQQDPEVTAIVMREFAEVNKVDREGDAALRSGVPGARAQALPASMPRR